MTAEQDGLDLAAIRARFDRLGETSVDVGALLDESERLAALALDLQGKVADAWDEGYQKSRDDAWNSGRGGTFKVTDNPYKVADWRAFARLHHGDAALADPTPAALCPKVSPLETLTDRTCAKPAGHAGPCLFAGHDGRTDLEVMPK